MSSNLELTSTDLVDITNVSSTIEAMSDVVPINPTATTDTIAVGSNEFSIVGDAIYVKSYTEVPTWFQPAFNKLLDLKGLVSSTDLATEIGSITKSINLVSNDYATAKLSIENLQGSFQTYVEQLNSNYEKVAINKITELKDSYATPQEAGNIVAQELKSVFKPIGNETPNEALARTIASSVANKTTSYASQITNLETSFEDSVSTVSSQVAESKSTANDAMTNWHYDSKIKIWDSSTNSYKYYSSGFGLISTGTNTGTSTDPFDSEFWVKADKFRVSSASNVGYTPFRIDSTGIHLDSSVHIGSSADAPTYTAGILSKRPSTANNGSVFVQTDANPYTVWMYYSGGGWVTANQGINGTNGVRGACSLAIDIMVASSYPQTPASTSTASKYRFQGTAAWTTLNTPNNTFSYITSAVLTAVYNSSTPLYGDTITVNVYDSSGKVLTNKMWVYTSSWSYNTGLAIVGDMFVDGSITGRAIKTDELVLGDNSNIKISNNGIIIKEGNVVRIRIGNLDPSITFDNWGN